LDETRKRRNFLKSSLIKKIANVIFNQKVKKQRSLKNSVCPLLFSGHLDDTARNS
jgi:hypothetical protein